MVEAMAADHNIEVGAIQHTRIEVNTLGTKVNIGYSVHAVTNYYIYEYLMPYITNHILHEYLNYCCDIKIMVLFIV